MDLWGAVVGQPAALHEVQRAVPAPVHAYLLVGPPGSGKRELARAFAAALLSEGFEGEAAARHARLALEEIHPDMTVIEREGASFSSEQADLVIARAARSAVEGGRKVLVLDEFHLAGGIGAKLLKTIEEPGPDTFFLVLADDLTPSLETIASRCVRIDLTSVGDEEIAAALAAQGVPSTRIEDAVRAAAGDLTRARLLATDERLGLRLAAWRAVPDRLDGHGGTILVLVDELLSMTDESTAALEVVQAREREVLDARVSAVGERGAGRKRLEERHKRQQRRYRSAELRAGLTELSRRYRDELSESARALTAASAIELIADCARAQVRNPNERLQLVALLSALDRLGR